MTCWCRANPSLAGEAALGHQAGARHRQGVLDAEDIFQGVSDCLQLCGRAAWLPGALGAPLGTLQQASGHMSGVMMHMWLSIVSAGGSMLPSCGLLQAVRVEA